MIATLGFYDLTTVRVLVALDLACIARRTKRPDSALTLTPLEGARMLIIWRRFLPYSPKQDLKLLFNVDFLLQAGIVFHRIQLLKLRGQLRFQCFEFGKFGHEKSVLGLRHVKAH